MGLGALLNTCCVHYTLLMLCKFLTLLNVNPVGILEDTDALTKYKYTCFVILHLQLRAYIDIEKTKGYLRWVGNLKRNVELVITLRCGCTNVLSKWVWEWKGNVKCVFQ